MAPLLQLAHTHSYILLDYIITTEAIERNTTSLIIDEEGTLRIKGKKESDHNTILMAIKVNNPRKRQYIVVGVTLVTQAYYYDFRFS